MIEQLEIIIWFSFFSFISIFFTLIFIILSEDEFDKGTAWIWLLCSFSPIPGVIIPLILICITLYFLLFKLPTIIF